MKNLSIIVTLCIIPRFLFAWGDLGHRVVGEIAEKFLSSRAKNNVSQILGEESLAKASIWADTIKSEPQKLAEIAKRWPVDKKNPLKTKINSWHYVSISDESDYEKMKKNPEGDIVWAIDKMMHVLRAKESGIHHKREALRLLVHYVGDIHQPLHVGNEFDRGANNCFVKFFPQKKISMIRGLKGNRDVHNVYNLHVVWDSKILETMQMSYTEIAEDLLQPSSETLRFWNEVYFLKSPTKDLNELTTHEIKTKFNELLSMWKTAKIEEWLNESMTIRPLVYPNNPHASKKKTHPLSYCSSHKNKNIKAKNIPTISWAQRHLYLQITRVRLLQAGIRLAHLLNEI